MTLEAGREYLIFGKIETDLPDTWTMMASQSDEKLDESIIVGRTLCIPGSTKDVPIRLVVWGKAQVVLHKNTIIANLEYIEDTDREESKIKLFNPESELLMDKESKKPGYGTNSADISETPYDPHYIPSEAYWTHMFQIL
uniref:Uncharacterized protein n=1 Tax=Acrobeloides nanus TaxID=290746 RepID=A0A914EM95_9BILA